MGSAFSLWAGGWFPPSVLARCFTSSSASPGSSCTVVVSRKVRGRSLGPGYISGVAKRSSADPNYCTQHLIWALSFPSEHSYLGTSPASVLFGGICLAMAGMRYSSEHVISRLEQKWLSPLTSPARQDAKQASRTAEGLLAQGTCPSIALKTSSVPFPKTGRMPILHKGNC